ncbi:HAD-IA family hydrolase [Candidatus Woesebacteria bacterium]|nr:HAD-IA family hydrolase [Candidatus Woesebacteria bacterium]
MPIKFIYFDIGGVFVDHMSAWGSVARELGVSQNDVVSLFLKHVAELDRGTLSWNAFETILYQELHPRRNLSAPLNVTFVSNFTKIEATHAFAHEIAKKTPIGLLSNISADILTLLKKADLIPDLPYHAVIASGALGHIKPEKEIFTVALEHVPCLPQEVLFIDDSEQNLAGARKLGLQTHHFQTHDPEASLREIRDLYREVS